MADTKVREITTHHVEGKAHNERLVAMEGTCAEGGAPSVYFAHAGIHNECRLGFQTGPIEIEADINGITNEQLLAVVLDRLRCWQEGPDACEENERAAACILFALHTLKDRTSDRLKRGVEGAHKP